MSARTETLARLQGEVSRLENASANIVSRVTLGHAEADAALQGGLKRGAFHEVYAADGRQGAAMTGFALGLAQRLTAVRGYALWVRQDFAAREAGELSMSGFAEFGFDPRRLVVVRAPNATVALRTIADGLACNALSVVIGEIWGETKAFDLAASRKLTLGAEQSGVTAMMLRLNALPQASTAETRWILRAGRSPPVADWEAWGAPIFDAELVRNRHGPTGRWIMTWMCDDAVFGEAATEPLFAESLVPKLPANSQPAVAAPLHRPHPAVLARKWGHVPDAAQRTAVRR